MKLKNIYIQAIYSLGHQDEHKCSNQAQAHFKNKEIIQKKRGNSKKGKENLSMFIKAKIKKVIYMK